MLSLHIELSDGHHLRVIIKIQIIMFATKVLITF